MLLSVNGYSVKNVSSVQVVSVAEGKRLRRKDLEADKRRGSYFKPYVNPDTWTEEERKFMEE